MACEVEQNSFARGIKGKRKTWERTTYWRTEPIWWENYIQPEISLEQCFGELLDRVWVAEINLTIRLQAI